MTRPTPHTLLRLATLALLACAATLWSASHLAPRLLLRDHYSTHTALALHRGQFAYVSWGVGREPWTDPLTGQPAPDAAAALPRYLRQLPDTAAGLGFRFFTGRPDNDLRHAPTTLLVLPLWLPTTLATLLLLATWPTRHARPIPVTTFTPTRPTNRPPYTRPIPAARPTPPTPTITPTPTHT